MYYLIHRYYDPEIGRFISIDDPLYLDFESLFGTNRYAYCLDNPVMGVDPSGTSVLSILLSIAVAACVGAAVGVAATFVSDVVTSVLIRDWQLSSWETYLGAAIGSAVGGVISLFSSVAGIIIGGTLSTIAGHAIGKMTGSNTSSWGEIFIDTIVSLCISIAFSGLDKYLKIPGITKGSHSFQQVFKSGFTKAIKYNYFISIKTLAKEAVYLLVSSFTTGYIFSGFAQGVYNAVKISIKRFLSGNTPINPLDIPPCPVPFVTPFTII